MNWVEKTVIFTFLVWGYFYAKYNFYQDSINEHEHEEDEKVQEALFLKKYLQYKLKVPGKMNMSEEELLSQYQRYAYEQMQKNSQLDMMLTNIRSTTFDQRSLM